MAEGGPESEVRGRGRGREMKFGPLVIWSTLGQSCPLPPLPPPPPSRCPRCGAPCIPLLWQGRPGVHHAQAKLSPSSSVQGAAWDLREVLGKMGEVLAG